MSRLGVVTGLAAEAALIRKSLARSRRPVPGLAVSGPDAARAEAAAAKLIAEGAEVLVSFGLCGGLDPALRPGDVLLAEEVVAENGARFATDPGRRADLAARLEACGLTCAGGALAGASAPVATAAAKAALFESSGARAVDMESHGIARAAQARGVPLLVVRAVGDPAERSLPRAALTAIGPEGRLRLLPALVTMYLRPWESPGLIRLAYEARLGFDSLEQIARQPGGLFGGD